MSPRGVSEHFRNTFLSHFPYFSNFSLILRSHLSYFFLKTSLSQIVNEETEFNEKQLRAGAGVRIVIFSAICDIFTFGACSRDAANAENILSKKQATLLKFQTMTGNIDDAILIATNYLSEEIDVLLKWHMNVDVVASNIDDYPVEYLRMFKPIKNYFIRELINLRQSADEFLSHGKLFEENIDSEN